MKYLTMAIALVIAAPAAAQTAPAQNPGHDQHQPQAGQHGQHQQGQEHHGQHQQSGHQQGEHQQSGHEQHGEGCCADRNENGRMDCCEQAEGAEARACCAEQPGERQGEHSGH